MPEGRSIAVAAVVVSGVVGVTAPVVTWLSTRSAQRNQAHTQLVREDRAELRSVLDNAAVALTRAVAAASRDEDDWRLSGHDGLTAPFELSKPLNDVRFGIERLSVRLGRDAPVVRASQRAFLPLLDLTLLYQQPYTEPLRKKVLQRLTQAEDAEAAFIAAAQKLAGSTLR
jgi:hypothetical protein